MRGKLLLVMAILIGTSGCSRVADSRINPLNWFGSSEPVATAAPLENAAVDPRPLIAQVVNLEIEPATGGAIVRATGLPPRQGFHDVALLATNDGEPLNGVLQYRFVAMPPPRPTPVVNVRSREVEAAAFVSDAILADTHEIHVLAAQNARSTRRR